VGKRPGNVGRLGFRPADAIVYASIIQHARTDSSKKIFLNKDRKDFANPDVYEELAALNCTLILKSEDALSLIENPIRKE
jgi:hypothetical protein